MNFSYIGKRAFCTKIALLAIFSLSYLPLASIKESASFKIYLATLLAIHAYFFIILLSRVAWRELKSNRAHLFARIATVTLLTIALIALGKSPLRAELLAFLTISFVLHVLLVSALHVRIYRSVKELATIKVTTRAQ